MLMLYIPVGVALVCFILYALDRRAKQEPIDWVTAIKLSTFGSLISGGITYVTTTGESVLEVAKHVATDIPIIEEMFVGVPTF